MASVRPLCVHACAALTARTGRLRGTALLLCCRHVTTVAQAPPQQPSSSSTNPSASSFSSTRSPPPPPLSILSWAVDGSGHTHHRCQRRLSMAQRIPLLCQAIRATAPDVVALQDSTPEMAAALTAQGPAVAEGIAGEVSETANTLVRSRALHIHCAELARELQHPRLQPSSQKSATSAPPPDAASADNTGSSGDAPMHVEAPPHPTPPPPPPCQYRLVGRARNGRCGEVQLFVKESAAWEAVLLPGMGAGVTVELCSRAREDPTDGSRRSEEETSGSTSAAAAPHRCVLTTLDLSYRGKSLGTNAQGLLTDAAISADGSPFTLRTQQPSASASPSTQRRGGRALGQLDAHRAIVFDWVHHHVRPDVLVGNVFMGARERVPGFEDAWVRAGSPAGQERTTNTCARHRVDRVTNYYYFKPSPGVASAVAMRRMTDQEQPRERKQEAVEAEEPGTAVAAAGCVIDSTSVAAGTPIPLTASFDSGDKSWHAAAASGSADSEDPSRGMPEVAGRFQRCLLRSWVRRGPSSRSGHRSAHPLLRQYRHCRVVVLRPMTEVTLHPQEQAWHARYIAAQYSRAPAREHADRPSVGSEMESAREEGEAEERHDAPTEQGLRLARVPSQVRCSLSDQYPLLTLLS